MLVLDIIKKSRAYFEDIKLKRAHKRQIIISAIRTLRPDQSFPQIASHFNLDHSTAVFAFKACQKDPIRNQHLIDLLAHLNEN